MVSLLYSIHHQRGKVMHWKITESTNIALFGLSLAAFFHAFDLKCSQSRCVIFLFDCVHFNGRRPFGNYYSTSDMMQMGTKARIA